MDFKDALKEKVLIFDGAMGSSIHSFDLSLDDYDGIENCPEILVESKPEVIQQIHESFFAVGCDVVETDTFGGSPVVLAEFGLAHRAYELNKTAAQLARAVAADYSRRGHKRYVSGSIGPTTKLPSLGHISFAEMTAGYYQQVAGLVDGGVDVLQFETGQDLLQAKAALVAMFDYFAYAKRRLPVITQVTLEAPPLSTMLVGSDISAALTVLSSFPIDVIGINCATGPTEMIDHIQYLCRNTELAVSVLPNAGLPENVNGQTVYKLRPDELAHWLKYFALEQGVNIVGGCCGTTPAHLQAVCQALSGAQPLKRKTEHMAATASLYTAQPMRVIPAPTIIGERTNTNGSRKFKQLLESEDLDAMVAMARDQEREGAHLLDVCTAYVGRNEVHDMTAFIKRLNTEMQIPLVIDTTEYAVLEATLPLVAGKAVVNSINLEDGEKSMLRKAELIKKYGAAAIALTIDEEGMAKSADKKLAVARRIYDLAISLGIAGEDLIFDDLTFTLSTGNVDDRRLGLETLEGIRLIKQAMPDVQTSLGVSNISFGFDAKIRQILNSVFLHYAIEYGLDMAIVNAAKILPLYKIGEEEIELHRKLIFDERTDSYDPLFALLDYYQAKSAKGKTKVKAQAAKEIEEVLKQRVIDGQRVGLEKDLEQALAKYAPLDIINNILLDGMKVVGELFGSGKMQLPFVLQSAETMKAAVSYLEPFMDRVQGSSLGTMVLATVKGDVHDIGKNLVDIILSNNGYKVVNLGIKQPIENIVAAARDHKADCIGMSGLLVKSTVIMKENLEVLNQHGITTPVILGGAALTRRYVEQDCRQVYHGKVFYGADAFADLHFMEALAAGTVDELLKPTLATVTAGVVSADAEQKFLVQVKESIAIGEGSSAKIKETRSDVERNLPIPTPPFWGTKIVDDISLKVIFAHINENVLIRGRWQVRQGDTADAEYEAMLSAKIRPILRQWQERAITERLLTPQAVYGYFPCQSEGQDLIVYHPDNNATNKKELVRFTFPRQTHGRHLCISDFFASTDEGHLDTLPLFIVTVGEQATEFSNKLFQENKYTDYLYFHGLSVESAEGLAEVMHKRMRAELGVASEDSPDMKKLLNQGYRGTRYSFGYPACPNLQDQVQLFELLKPQRIGISLTEEYQLVPEQSTSAIVVVHPQAKYFNILEKVAADPQP